MIKKFVEFWNIKIYFTILYRCTVKTQPNRVAKISYSRYIGTIKSNVLFSVDFASDRESFEKLIRNSFVKSFEKFDNH